MFNFYSPRKSAAFPCIMIVDALPSYMAVMNSAEPAGEESFEVYNCHENYLLHLNVGASAGGSLPGETPEVRSDKKKLFWLLDVQIMND